MLFRSLEVDDEYVMGMRYLRAHKNRFGSTLEVGALEMTATGMIPSEHEPRDQETLTEMDAVYQPLAQELLSRYLSHGGKLDDGLRDRIGTLLDLDAFAELTYVRPTQWEYGPASMHEEICRLHENDGIGHCDCKMSIADGVDRRLLA